MGKAYLTKLSVKLIYLGFQCLLPCGLSDLIATPRGRPYEAVTQLREISACKSSFLEVHLAQGVTTWVSTHAPQPLVTRPESVSAFLSHHAHGLPWAWPSPGSYLSQGFSRGGVGTSRVRLLPTRTGDMAFKPPFSFPYYCSEVPGPRSPCPYRGLSLGCPLHGLPYPWVSEGVTIRSETYSQNNGSCL